MIFTEPLEFVADFIESIDQGLREHDSNLRLKRTQKSWLSFCVMSVFLTRTVCWAKFERACLGTYSMEAISWMFRKSKIPWGMLLTVSTTLILRRFGITHGSLAIDETDKKRSKSVKRIYKAHKIKDKSSGWYIMGQSVVFIVLITPKITIPVGFDFYMPDPKVKKWKQEDDKLRKRGIPKKSRPAKPEVDMNFPKVPAIGINLLRQFLQNHPTVKIDCVLADALYGTQSFLDEASNIFGGVQVISQIKKNQNIRFKNKEISVQQYFTSYPGTKQTIKIRGGKKQKVIVGAARLHVCSHNKKRFVIALKYEGEKDYRYIVANDLSWRYCDIVEAYTLRWLIEVFFEDWKASEGWGKLTKHTGKKGSSQGLILSLMVDHCLFFHPDQKAFIDNNLAACTVGSLMRQIRIECFLQFIRNIVTDKDPGLQLDKITEILKNQIFVPLPSSKHMSGKKLGRMEQTASLKNKNEDLCPA